MITVGSVSKSFWGGLRIGWMRVPETLVARVLDARASMDLGAPVLEQLVVARLLRQRSTILPERRARSARRRDALADGCRRSCCLRGGSSAGWWVVAVVRAAGAGGVALVGVAQRNGVLLVAGSRFSPDGGLESFIRLPFTLDPDTLRDGVQRLAASYDGADRGFTGTPYGRDDRLNPTPTGGDVIVP